MKTVAKGIRMIPNPEWIGVYVPQYFEWVLGEKGLGYIAHLGDVNVRVEDQVQYATYFEAEKDLVLYIAYLRRLHVATIENEREVIKNQK